MWCFVGLGNIGSEYESTPHNVGFELIDRLAIRWKIPVKQRNPLFLFGSGDHRNHSVLLVKPTTYMNRSGEAFRRLLADPDIKLDQTLIFVDDIHLPLGKIRIRQRGSDGGHNGIRSILQAAKTQEVARIRIGVGGNEEDWIEHVLSPFSKRGREVIDETLDRAEDAVEAVMHLGIEKAMNLYNR